MLELKELEVKFKFKDKEYFVRELTVGDLEELEKKVSKGDLTEVGLYREMMALAGLESEVAQQLSLRHLKQLSGEINKEK